MFVLSGGPQMSLRKQPVLFLDIQTTGAKPETAHILEMAWGSLHSEAIESSLVLQPEEFPFLAVFSLLQAFLKKTWRRRSLLKKFFFH